MQIRGECEAISLIDTAPRNPKSAAAWVLLMPTGGWPMLRLVFVNPISEVGAPSFRGSCARVVGNDFNSKPQNLKESGFVAPTLANNARVGHPHSW